MECIDTDTDVSIHTIRYVKPVEDAQTHCSKNDRLTNVKLSRQTWPVAVCLSLKQVLGAFTRKSIKGLNRY